MAREASAPGQELTAAFDAFSFAALKAMARTLGVKPSAEQRAAYVEAVASAAGTPQHRAALDRRLQPVEWDLLKLLPARFGPVRLRVFLIDGEKPGAISEERLRSTLTLFASACLVPTGQLRPGAAHLGIDRNAVLSMGANTPLKLVPGVSDWARAHRPPAPLPLREPPERVSGPALQDLQRTAFVILAEAGRKPIRLTQDGQPYKADVRSLAALMTPAEGKKLRGYTAPVPPLVFFALAVLSGAGLLAERHGELRPAARSDQFFSAPPERQAQILLDGWYESSFKDFLLIPGLSFGWGQDLDAPWFKSEDDSYSAYAPRHVGVAVGRRCITTAIAEGIAEAPDGWYSIADIARTVFLQYPEMLFPRMDEYGYSGFTYFNRPNGRRAYMSVQRQGEGEPATPRDRAARTLYQDSDWMEVEGAFVREAIAGPLRWLGVAEVGPDAGIADRFHLTELGQQLLCGRAVTPAVEAPAGKRAVVQPNYEVIVLDSARNLGLLSQLDAFAERRSLDRAATYRLTQAALGRGLDRGWTGKRVFKALETANDGPLPQNVRYSLEEWIRLYESLSLHEATCLLEADDAGQLDGWLADPALAKLLGDRLGPTIVRVGRRQITALLGQLEHLGATAATVDYALPPAALLELQDPDRILLESGRAEPYACYQLEAFSEPAGETRAHRRYQITEASVRRAAKQGWREPQLRAFLNQATKNGMPPDLSVRLSGWSGLVPAAQAETLVAVALPAAPVPWEMLRDIPEIGALIRALPTPELALVAPGDLETLQAALQARGIGLQTAMLSAEQLRGVQPEFAAGEMLPRVLLVRDENDPNAELGDDLSEIDLGEISDLVDPVAFLDYLGWGRKPKRGR